MQDRFKFRCWHKIYKKIYDVYSITPFGVVISSLAVSDKKTNFEDCIIMQCTGIKDKSGKLIYEGDIVTDGYHNMLVYYDQEDCAFALQKKTKYTLKRFGKNGFERLSLRNLSEDNFKNHQLKIIGNIYENPELLELKA